MIDQLEIVKLVETEISKKVEAEMKSLLEDDAWKEVVEQAVVKYAQDRVNAKFNSSEWAPQLVDAVENSVKRMFDTGQIKELSSIVDESKIFSIVDSKIEPIMERRFNDPDWSVKTQAISNQIAVSKIERNFKDLNVEQEIQRSVQNTIGNLRRGINDSSQSPQLTITDEYVVNENELITRLLRTTEHAQIDGDITVSGTLILKGRVNTDNESWIELKDTITGNVLNEIQSQTTEQLTEDILTLAKTQGIDFDMVLIDGKKLIDGDQLTPTVTKTKITEVGRLSELAVQGFTSLNNETLTVLNTRVGINTDKPTMALELWDQEVSMSMGKISKDTGFVGLSGKGSLHIGLNQQGDIRIDEDGIVRIPKLRIGRNNVTWSDKVPGHQGLKGDIVFNSGSNEVTGWRCTGGFNWNQF